MRKGNILLIILVAVVVMVAAVGGYFYLWPRFRYPIQDISCLDDNQCSPEYYCYKNPENKDMFYLGGPGECVKGQRRSQVATPSDDPTANWKTYTDSKYGYSLKYPPQWEINPPPLGNGILIGLNEPNEDQIAVNVSPIKDAIMAESCKQTQQVFLNNVPASRCELTQKIGAERGVVYNPPITSKTVYIEALHNDRYYNLSLTFNQTSDKFKTFDQILSTFKFLNTKITMQKAIELVRNQKDVQNWLLLFTGPDHGRPVLAFDHMDANKYVIHVYEDLPDHVATLNWFEVDSETGAVTRTFN